MTAGETEREEETHGRGWGGGLAVFQLRAHIFVFSSFMFAMLFMLAVMLAWAKL